MTSELIERMAKAIGDDLYGYVDKIDTPTIWGMSVGIAKTALKAAREPTEKIKNVVTGSIYCSAEEIWQTMIDAELEE